MFRATADMYDVHDIPSSHVETVCLMSKSNKKCRKMAYFRAFSVVGQILTNCRKSPVVVPGNISTKKYRGWNSYPGNSVAVCKMDISPEELLQEDGEENAAVTDETVLQPGDLQILKDYHSFTANQQKRLLSYMKRIKKGTDEK